MTTTTTTTKKNGNAADNAAIENENQQQQQHQQKRSLSFPLSKKKEDWGCGFGHLTNGNTVALSSFFVLLFSWFSLRFNGSGRGTPQTDARVSNDGHCRISRLFTSSFFYLFFVEFFFAGIRFLINGFGLNRLVGLNFFSMSFGRYKIESHLGLPRFAIEYTWIGW